jgi:hypothetical protein
MTLLLGMGSLIYCKCRTPGVRATTETDTAKVRILVKRIAEFIPLGSRLTGRLASGASDRRS